LALERLHTEPTVMSMQNMEFKASWMRSLDLMISEVTLLTFPRNGRQAQIAKLHTVLVIY
jgi:hypothetical protein